MPRPDLIWLITDTHFGHSKIAEYCDRPLDFNDLIVKNWKRVVLERDTIIHLGDVSFDLTATELSALLGGLPGTKILVKGNHDKHSSNWYKRNGFSFVCDGLLLNKVYFSHKPILFHKLPEGADLNIHGHFHNNPPSRWDCSVGQKNRLLCLEWEDYKPVEFWEFLRSKDRYLHKTYCIVAPRKDQQDGH